MNNIQIMLLKILKLDLILFNSNITRNLKKVLQQEICNKFVAQFSWFQGVTFLFC